MTASDRRVDLRTRRYPVHCLSRQSLVSAWQPLEPHPAILRVFPQYHSAPAAYDTVLKHLNSAFTVLFSMECMLKIMAFGIVVRPAPLRAGCPQIQGFD